MTHGRAKHHRRLRMALAVCLVLMVQAGALAAVIQVYDYQELIDKAAVCNAGDIIELMNDITREDGQGTAKITANGVTFRSSAGNQFLINNGDDGAGQTIPGRLLEVGDDTTPVNDFTLENVVMSGGSTTGDYESGGALYVHGDGATISHCTFTGNHTEGTAAHGGAVFISGANAQVVDSTFEENYTKGQVAYGGGAYINGANAQVMHSTFEQNQTTGPNAHGGGAFISGADSTIEGSTFEGNQATGPDSTGGGVAYNILNTDSATIKDTGFYGNTSTTGGGAITGPNTAITIWGVNYYLGNTPEGSTEVDGKYVGIEAKSVNLAPGAQVIEGRRPASVDEAQIVGAGPNNRASRYTARRDLPVYRQETAGSERTGTLPAGTETTVMQISGGMALTPKGYVEFAGLTRVTGQ